MSFKTIVTAVTAAMLVAAPTAASANPAAKLSVSSSVRASADDKDASRLFGGGWLPVAVLAVVAVAAIVALESDSADDGPDSP